MPARRRPGRWPAAAITRRLSESIRRSSRRSTAASAPARDRMSRPRCSPRVSGRRAFRSKPHSCAKFFGLHDRKNPANAAMNVYRAADGIWFVLIVTPDKVADVAKAIGRLDLLTDPRFSDPAKLAANMSQLTTILDEVFGAQPMAHWYGVFSGVHVTFGAVRGPQEVMNDLQLTANNIVIPLEGAGGKLTSTINSPIQVHGVAKMPARRAPHLGEHTEDILGELGFSAKDIEGLRTGGAVRKAEERAA